MMAKSLTHAAAVAIIGAAFLLSGSALADERDQARAHYQRGNQLFHAGDYRGAVLEFQTANKLAPSPILHFNIGLCHDRLGRPKRAIAHYKKYLKKVPNAANRAQVESSIRRLGGSTGKIGADAARAAADAQRNAEAERAKEAERAAAAEAATKADGDPAAGNIEAEAAPEEAPMPGADSISDPALARAQAIDVAAYRDQFAGASTQAAPAPAPAARGSSFPPPEKSPSKSSPFYKKWWFWVAVGVGAIVVISVATGDDDSSNSTNRGLLAPRLRRAQDSGAVLLRFWQERRDGENVGGGYRFAVPWGPIR
jgi:hypothetical protein